MNKKNSLLSLAEEFILYKRSLGCIYETPCYYLMNYVRYTDKGQIGEWLLNKESVKRYLDTLVDARGSLYGSVAVLREFGRYLMKCGYEDVYIIPNKIVALPTPEPPYFFTSEEIKQFFGKCDSIKPHPSFRGRELALPAMFRILYCCGMRCKEVRTLLYEDVHLEGGFLDIKQSKGPKSRRIYISAASFQNISINMTFLYPSCSPIGNTFFPAGRAVMSLEQFLITSAASGNKCIRLSNLVQDLEHMIFAITSPGQTLTDGQEKDWMLMSCYHI